MSGFATTRWSLILQARNDGASGRGALDQLCRSYREPVAAYIRHRGANSSEVEDLVQAFFLHFLERDLHVRADRYASGGRTTHGVNANLIKSAVEIGISRSF